MMYPVNKDQEIELEIEKLAFGGKGLARLKDYVIFVDRTLPGERVKVRIVKRKPNYAEARLLTIIDPSPLRVAAPCGYFGECGGCSWQNLDYENQLKFKKEHVQESLQQLAGIQECTLYDPLPSSLIWGYRNKMEFSFSDRRWFIPADKQYVNQDRTYVLGLHVAGTHDKILNIDYCLLQNEFANKVLKIVDNFCALHQLPVYSIKSGKGFLRFLVIRYSFYSHELMVVLVTAKKSPERLKPLVSELVFNLPQITSIVNAINTRPAQIAYGEEYVVLYGRDHIVEKINDLQFKISANSFFQTNSYQTQTLYRVVLDYADLNGTECVWDLYSGTGTISLHLAAKARQVIGFELEATAVHDARDNSTENRITNCKYISGDLLANLKQIEQPPQLVITDPPRSGMHSKVCGFLNGCGARKIIYVSCNPTTLARDIKLLNQNYQLKRVQPVDMFPHTYHIETVCELVSR
jgi:23S rRNA (uracil1939-C5)-methyltransferase